MGLATTRLAEIDPEAVILHAVKCYHGESHEGWLVGTLDQLWWLEKGIFGSAEQPLSYTWGVEVRKRSHLTSTSPVGIQARRGLLAIGGGLFQMHARQLDDFGLFLRQMQLALGRLGDSDPLSESVVAEAAVAQPVSPTSLLKELAELRDLGVVTEDEFQAKKTEILSKQW